jgi:hypothetical protein
VVTKDVVDSVCAVLLGEGEFRFSFSDKSSLLEALFRGPEDGRFVSGLGPPLTGGRLLVSGSRTVEVEVFPGNGFFLCCNGVDVLKESDCCMLPS